MTSRRMVLWVAVAAGSTAIVGCGGPPPGQAPPGTASGAASTIGTAIAGGAVVLDSLTIARIGIRTAVLAASVRPPETELAAEVVADPGAAATVRAGVAGRLTVVPGTEWPGVGDHLRAGAMVAQVGDARPIQVPREGTVLRVLAQPGELVQPGQELLQLVDYRSALVRVTMEEPRTSPPDVLAVSALAGGQRLTGRYVGPSSEADPITRGPAWLYRVGGAESLRPGMTLLAYQAAPRGSASTVLVPAQAVVQWDALTWVYLERTPGHFVRVRLATDRPVGGGWLASTDLGPGDRVVMTGAGQLLSEEFRARISVGQEVGE